ncbi:PhnD/SsuA/transferrin family substrate-binding protein [Hydrogenophilus thiooxidans]|uniref:PhnD/SsuA/transferrin family substrate-binding protein n=1 Tax=Hydrogenophilus thiooxidans TaxID=2820326 RepID=UPI001C2340B0|nr:PhnD/SsuA/transferrin family substrate-binding protein [Hydrogenophilus thiooxidans]
MARPLLARLLTLLSSTVLLLFGCIPALRAEDSPFRIGIFAYQKPEIVAEQFAPLVRAIGAILSRPVEVAYLQPDPLEARVAAETLDLLITNPTHFIELQERYPLSAPVLTLTRFAEGHFVRQLGSTLLRRQDAPPVDSLQALEGQTILIPSKRHLGGYQAFAFELFLAGVDVATITWQEVGTHEAVVEALARGAARYGVVRSSIWEHTAQRAPEAIAHLAVAFDQTPPGYPFRVSTRLYPEWPVALLPHVDDATASALISGLLALQLQLDRTLPPEWIQSGIGCCVRGGDYTSIRRLALAMREPPFTEVPVTWRDIWRQYRLALLAATAAFALALTLALVGMRTRALYRQVDHQKTLLTNQIAETNTILEALNEGVIVQNAADDVITYCNPAAAALLGYTPDELIGKPSHATLHYAHADGTPFPRTECPIFQTMRDGKPRRVDTVLWHKNGIPIAVHIAVAAIRDHRNAIVRAVTAVHDIREQQRLLEQIIHLAYHDPLTGLLNREGFAHAL